MRITRAEISRAPARVLNLGGLANPDVLLVETSQRGRFVVKDYARCAPWVRACLAPWLARRELALLEWLEGVLGVPRPLGRIDALAFALEWVDAGPLRRRDHSGALPVSFFAALEGILEALAARGVVYGDLRSPSNVLCTPDRAPVLVDLGSAARLPGVARGSRWLYAPALRKLARRFQASEVAGVEAAAEEGARERGSALRDLHAGRVRIRTLDLGPLVDPVPAIVLPDAATPLETLGPLLDAVEPCGRRAIGIELPGVGGSRGRDADSLSGHARWLARALDLLRVRRADVVGFGWAGLVARQIALEEPGRVRALVTVDAPVRELAGRFLRRFEAARQGPDALRRALAHDGGSVASLAGAVRAYRGLAAEPTPRGGWQLTHSPHPVQPWLAIGTESPDAPGVDPAGRGDLPAQARPVQWAPEDLGGRLWKELTALGSHATV